jgi:hypothetical protein
MPLLFSFHLFEFSLQNPSQTPGPQARAVAQYKVLTTIPCTVARKKQTKNKEIPDRK